MAILHPTLARIKRDTLAVGIAAGLMTAAVMEPAAAQTRLPANMETSINAICATVGGLSAASVAIPMSDAPALIGGYTLLTGTLAEEAHRHFSHAIYVKLGTAAFAAIGSIWAASNLTHAAIVWLSGGILAPLAAGSAGLIDGGACYMYGHGMAHLFISQDDEELQRQFGGNLLDVMKHVFEGS